jgi:hypothetical protein
MAVASFFLLCCDVLCCDVLCCDVLCFDVLCCYVLRCVLYPMAIASFFLLCCVVLCCDVLFCVPYPMAVASFFLLCCDVLCCDVMCYDVMCCDVMCCYVLRCVLYPMAIASFFLLCFTAKYRSILSPERDMKKQVHVRLKNMSNLVMGPKGRPDTKTYWPTDRRPQIQLHSTPPVFCILFVTFVACVQRLKSVAAVNIATKRQAPTRYIYLFDATTCR